MKDVSPIVNNLNSSRTSRPYIKKVFFPFPELYKVMKQRNGLSRWYHHYEVRPTE